MRQLADHLSQSGACVYLLCVAPIIGAHHLQRQLPVQVANNEPSVPTLVLNTNFPCSRASHTQQPVITLFHRLLKTTRLCTEYKTVAIRQWFNNNRGVLGPNRYYWIPFLRCLWTKSIWCRLTMNQKADHKLSTGPSCTPSAAAEQTHTLRYLRTTPRQRSYTTPVGMRTSHFYRLTPPLSLIQAVTNEKELPPDQSLGPP